MSIKPEHYDIIKRPVVTEKSTMASENNVVVFEVARSAAKPAIKEAVELLFNVSVVSVNTALIKGKAKRFRGRLGRQSDVKKAYIRLQEGQSIDVGTTI